MKLTSEQLKQFDEEGYLFFRTTSRRKRRRS